MRNISWSLKGIIIIAFCVQLESLFLLRHIKCMVNNIYNEDEYIQRIESYYANMYMQPHVIIWPADSFDIKKFQACIREIQLLQIYTWCENLL